MISEVVSLVCFRSMQKRHNKRKSACEMLMQITFFRVFWVLKRCTGIFKVSNAWTNLWNTMMEKKRGQKAEFQEWVWKEWACLQSGGSCFWSVSFHFQSILKAGQSDWDKLNLIAQIIPKLTSRNPWHSAWLSTIISVLKLVCVSVFKAINCSIQSDQLWYCNICA